MEGINQDFRLEKVRQILNAEVANPIGARRNRLSERLNGLYRELYGINRPNIQRLPLNANGEPNDTDYFRKMAIENEDNPDKFDELIKLYVADHNRNKRSISDRSFHSGKRRKSSAQLGGTYLPAEYHGANSGRYTASPTGPATGAYGTQVARSQGIINGGDMAGPNLAYSGGNMMTGGGGKTTQLGGTYLPAEYHGADSGRYTASPSGPAAGAYGAQIARSQGIINGDMAGPNLAYSGGNMMTGGAKRTQRRRRHRKSTKKSLKQKAGSGCANKKGW